MPRSRVRGVIFFASLLGALGALAPAPTASPADPAITEFLAANSGVLLDEDGEASDWIEIFNPDGEPVDLSGWALTDDPLLPLQWVFPATTLATPPS